MQLNLSARLLKQLSLCVACGYMGFAQAGAFDQGATSISLVAGAGSAFNESYTIIGGGLDYFVLDGVQLGADAQAWFGGTRSIYKLSPQLRVVLTRQSDIKPYVGVFYRQTFIENQDNLESSGGRAGVYLRAGDHSSLSAGVVFESYSNCDESVVINCSETYPELVFSFSL